MELPQPKPFGIEGTGRKTTHDFLSLYTAAHQDQRSTQGKGGFIQTHDFLQPLEQLGKNGIREEDQEVDILDIKDAGKPRPPPGVVAVGPTLPVEHTLPGGIGTYSITSYNQRMMIPISKAEEYNNNNMMMAHAQAHTHAQANSNSCRNDENSNSSSYTTTTTGNVFTLWDESAAAVVNNMKGKTGKENIASNRGAVLREGGINQGNGQWTMPMDNNNPSSNHNQNTTTFSSPSSSQPSSANRNQSFMDMITSTKNNHHEDDDEEEEEEFVIKNEPSSYSRGNLSVKVDGKSTGQKPNTPRSKHSATEQRRRSKINDRFQKLREIIPHGDQKRDKASFLLEVIEYIQYLQEKVHKYDSNTYHGWSHEPPKIMPRINHRNAGDFMNQIQPTNVGSCPTVLLGTKFDETKAEKSTGLLLNGHPLVELDMSNAPNLRDNIYQTEPITKVEPAVQPQLPNNFCPVGTTLQPFSSSTSQQEGDVDKMPCHQPNTQIRSGGANSSITDKVKNRELCIESGAISISSRYSQGLLNNLTQALQSSGVDLSQASISVQIDLGKRANADVNTSTSIMKDNEIPKMNQEMPTTSSSMKNNNDESFQAMKRIKTSRS